MSNFQPPTSSQSIGTFGGVEYVRHKGKFVGQTVGGAFAVPYEITAPANPRQGNGTSVVEPPHFTGGVVARDGALGPLFMFGNKFSHVSVGYSNFRGRILDPNPGFTPKICGQDFPIPSPTTDLNILRQCAFVLRNNPPPFLGKVERVYGIGLSDSGNTVHEIYKHFGHKLFDITFACIARYFEPVKINVAQKPIFVINTEADFDARAVPNPNFPQYRWYGIPGAAHIPDSVLGRLSFPDPPPQGSPAPSIAGTSPLNWLPFLRALFVAGDRWARNVAPPPASTTIKVNARGEIARDARCNALGGIRHPALEAGEATFVASVVRGNGWELFGGYGNPKRLEEGEFPEYLNTFRRAADALLAAKFLLPGGHARLLREAQLQPPNTYTLNYLQGRLFPRPASDELD